MWSRTFHWSAVLFTLGMVHVRYQMGCLRCAYAHSTIYALWIAMVERKTYRRPDMARLVHGCPLSSFSCSKSHVLFAGVCLYLCFVVEVAVVVAVVVVLFLYVLLGQWQAIMMVTGYRFY